MTGFMPVRLVSKVGRSALVEALSQKILTIRGHRVMLDRDLATLYGIKAIALRQQVKRNQERFPEDFMFLLSEDEVREMVSQNVIPSLRSLGGGVPMVFTQEGIAMLSSVLKTPKAIEVNIAIMRAFVRMRESMIAHKDLAQRLDDLEKKYDSQFRVIFDAMRQLIVAPERKANPIGYIHPKNSSEKAKAKTR
jgi:hypothetical protein